MRAFCHLLLAMVMVADAHACRFAMNPASYMERLEEAPLVFVGNVTRLDGGATVFAVEQTIKGAPGPTFSLPLGSGSCDIRFQPGQRWLYAGGLQTDPSVLLQDEYGRPVYRDHPQPSPELEQLLAQAGAALFQPPLNARLTVQGAKVAFQSDPPAVTTWTGGAARGTVYDEWAEFDGVKSYRAELGASSGGATLEVMGKAGWKADTGAVISLSWDRGHQALLAIHSPKFGFLVIRPAPAEAGKATP